MYKLMGEKRGSKKNAKERKGLDFQSTVGVILNLGQTQILPTLILKSIHGTSNLWLLDARTSFINGEWRIPVD